MTAERPAKPYKTFPLWPHKSGSWCVVIDGERKSFGGWARDPKGDDAIGEYNKFMEARRRGQEPETETSIVTVREIVNRYLTRQHRRAHAGEITLRDYRDAMGVLEHFADFIGKGTRIANLRPVRFGELRADMMERELSAATMKRRIAHIKSMFKWAFDEAHIAAPPRYGGDFKPTAKAGPKRVLLFSPEEVCCMIAASALPLRPMIRLGIECGMGNTDIAELRWDEIDLDTRIVKLVRFKTKINRRCVISPALVADLKAWKLIQDKREVPREDLGLVFTTLNGLKYVREIPADDPKMPPRVVDSVATAFDKLLRLRLKMKVSGMVDGRSFYTLRRTHRTWTDELKDPHAAALVMGHGFNSTAGIYVQDVGDARLFALNDHVVARIKRTESLLRRLSKRGETYTPQPSPLAVATRKRQGRGGRFVAPSADRSRGRRREAVVG